MTFSLGQCASQSDSPDKDFLISDKGEYTFSGHHGTGAQTERRRQNIINISNYK
jgi:hypothetical protein